eukprot:jgi/Mesen1/2496/ME000159S01621
MGLLNALANIAIVPFLMASLLAVAPVVAFIKFLKYLLYSPFASVRGLVVIITGASSGIGEHMAYEYAKRGARLVLAARREEKLRQVAAKCEKLGSPAAVVCRADVSKEEDCRNIIETTVSNFQKVDVLVNNAGMAHSGLFEESDPKSFRATVDIDFWGNVWTTVHALPYLKETGGQIVVTASVAGYTIYARQGLYNAAKAAIIQFYDTLRSEPVGAHIDITILLPGFIQSELTAKASESHIPRVWPMMRTDTAARLLVESAIHRVSYAIVPFWYATWLLYRLLGPELSDWTERVFLLGQPPSPFFYSALEFLFGKEVPQHALESLSLVKSNG